MKILIVCEHASNAFGGEAMLPLNYFRLLAKNQHEVYLITHERVKATIQQIVDIQQENIFYVPDTAAHKLLSKYSEHLPERIRVVTFGFFMHLITQFYQWKLARRIVRLKKIDIIHEPAPVSAILPSAMFKLQAPVVIGPMNGGMTFPAAFSYMASKSEKLLYIIVRFFSSIYNIVIPGKLFATILLVANQRTKESLPKFRLGKVFEMTENGAFSTLDTPKESLSKVNLNVLFVGRLVDWKAVDIAIDAIKKSKTNAKLKILGDGPLRNELEAYSKEQAPDKVEFLGMVKHAEVNQYYDAADIFILPSIRECGGAVVLEAMARGLPVIATNWGGPKDYITEETGFLVDPKSRQYMVEEFSRIIDELSEHPDRRYQIGLAAINRINDNFLWDKKIQTILKIYKNAIEFNN